MTGRIAVGCRDQVCTHRECIGAQFSGISHVLANTDYGLDEDGGDHCQLPRWLRKITNADKFNLSEIDKTVLEHIFRIPLLYNHTDTISSEGMSLIAHNVSEECLRATLLGLTTSQESMDMFAVNVILAHKTTTAFYHRPRARCIPDKRQTNMVCSDERNRH